MRISGRADRPSSTGPGTAFRPDIEGLRAVAIGAVLVYHAGLAWTPGGFVGVDVFLVISGFLITSLIGREVERTGRLDLLGFWARRARRLLPASVLVLLFCALVTVTCLPAAERRTFGGDIVSAAAYVVNWRLGHRAVDYLAEDVGASPVQHYWSLAVEEQFYVVWPLLIAFVVLVTATRRRRAVGLAVLGLTVASFAWAVHTAAGRPGLTFFDTRARLWELGVGALLALAWRRVDRLPPRARTAMGWAGLGAIGYAVLRFDETVWPGAAALVPVAGAAAVLAARGDEATSRRGVDRLLGLRPATWVGGLSYSLYLWHWPFLVAAQGRWGHLRVREAALVVVASAVPAWLSYRFVESPLRRSPRLASTPRALVLAGAGTTVASLGGLAVVLSLSVVDTVPLASAAQAPGAVALDDPRYADVDWTTVEEVPAMRPSPLRLGLPAVYAHDRECMPDQPEERYTACDYGDVDGARTVVLVGDSKAAQWFSAVDAIARRNGWRLVFIGKDGCEFADVQRNRLDGAPSPTCDHWSRWALQRVLAEHPDVVLTVSRYGTARRPGQDPATPETEEAMVDGLVSHWRAVVASGAVLVPILDTPGRRHSGVPECVQAHLHHLTACGYPLAEQLPRTGQPAQRAAARRVPEARLLDMTDVVCPGLVVCPPVIGNVLVYRSGSHLTDTFVRTATPVLAARLARATGGLLGGAP